MRTASPDKSVCREPEVVPESGATSVLGLPLRIFDSGSPVASATSWQNTVRHPCPMSDAAQ